MSELRYVYFGKKESAGSMPHKGIVAVGYRFNDEKKCMEYAIAFCSPNDRFAKEKAYRIIDARFENGLIETSTTGDMVEPPKFNDTVTDIVVILTKAIQRRESIASMYGQFVADKGKNVSFAGIQIPRWVTVDMVNSR